MLARSIAEKRDLNIRYETVDILTHSDSFRPKYDLAIDKGTYDAIGLCPDDPKAKRYQYRNYLCQVLKNESTFIITSCNWTTKELVDFFTEDDRKFYLNLI